MVGLDGSGLIGGLGFEVWGLRFRVWGLGFRVWGLGFRVWGFGFVHGENRRAFTGKAPSMGAGFSNAVEFCRDY